MTTKFDAYLASLSEAERRDLYRSLISAQEQGELVERHVSDDGRLYARAHSGKHAGSLVWQVQQHDVSGSDPGWGRYRNRQTGDEARMIRIHGPFAADRHCDDGWLAEDASGELLAVDAADHAANYEEVSEPGQGG